MKHYELCSKAGWRGRMEKDLCLFMGAAVI